MVTTVGQGSPGDEAVVIILERAETLAPWRSTTSTTGHPPRACPIGRRPSRFGEPGHALCPVVAPTAEWLCGPMATSVSLTDSSLVVDPGETITTEMRVRNTGDVVDQYNFQPLGDGAAWITVEPASVRLFPETDQTVTVRIAPPREPATTPGVATWAVKAVPSEHPDAAAVAEGTVEVGEFAEIGAELQPVAGRGRLIGRYEIAIDNRGNIPMPVRLTGTDNEQNLAYEFADEMVETAPGRAQFTKLRIRPADRIWRGQSKSHPFQILVEPQQRQPTGAFDADEPAPTDSGLVAEPGSTLTAAPPTADPIVLAGTLLQEPILPKWLLKAVLALLALLLVLFILWKTLLKPQVESAARAVAIEEVDQVEEQVAAVEEEVEDVAEEAAVAQETAEVAEQSAAAAEEAAEDAGGGGGGGGALDNVFNETTEPTHSRLTVAADPGLDDEASAGAMPADTTFAMTDVILQNPGGDVGLIRVMIDDDVVLESALESFRDLDFHFVSPYIVQAGQELRVELACADEQVVEGDPCSAAASFAGFTTESTQDA